MNSDRFLSTQDRTNYTILTNARRLCAGEYKRLPNFALAKELFGLGDTAATLLCRQCGLDPDANYAVRTAA